jgi:hypothetical protein
LRTSPIFRLDNSLLQIGDLSGEDAYCTPDPEERDIWLALHQQSVYFARFNRTRLGDEATAASETLKHGRASAPSHCHC